MRSQVTLSQIINITLGIIMAGLLAVLPHLARPVPAQAQQAAPAASHCTGIGGDATASTLLAANPELSVACRFVIGMAQQKAIPGASFVNVAAPETVAIEDNRERAFEVEAARYTALANHYAIEANVQQARAAEAARYEGLAQAYNRENGPAGSQVLAENPELNAARNLETSRRVAASTYSAANPEVMTAHRYTTTPAGAGLAQQAETIQRVGLAEYLAAEREAGLPQPDRSDPNRGR